MAKTTKTTSKKPYPSTPRELLEARYQAFVDQDIDFILESCHPDVKDQQDLPTIEAWSKNAIWHHFEIEKEEVEKEKAIITFNLKYEEKGKMIYHRELAEFRKQGSKWYYYDSTFPKPETLKREGPKVGRNDPCHCGSGKKFKKCCAA
ncbi:MAG: SEC-C domain-containing protein [Deltaproteobacteria bacterium]|nr:SEC-C domain-containing protein [Deltaproteobacteria bacterium]